MFGQAARFTEATLVHRLGQRYRIRYSASVRVALRISKYVTGYAKRDQIPQIVILRYD